MATVEPLLELRNVAKQLGRGERVFRLKIAHFTLNVGQELALVGASGSGKTTLLHLISGIIAADEGIISLAGTDIMQLTEAQRDRFRAEHIGCVYQTFNLLQGLTAVENVLLAQSFASTGFVFKRKEHDHERAQQLLARLGLGDKLRRKPRELSIGEQQRVAVARALINKPALLLADEPTANVDARNVARVIEEMRTVAAEQQTAVLTITHDKAVQEMFPQSIALEDIVS